MMLLLGIVVVIDALIFVCTQDVGCTDYFKLFVYISHDLTYAMGGCQVPNKTGRAMRHTR